jgi:hypothetical protein
MAMPKLVFVATLVLLLGACQSSPSEEFLDDVARKSAAAAEWHQRYAVWNGEAPEEPIASPEAKRVFFEANMKAWRAVAIQLGVEE